MAYQRITSSNDGSRLTVNTMIKDPTLIPMKVLSMLDQQFIVNKVLRDAGAAPGGSVIYYESTPLFAEDNAFDVEEWGEIPATMGDMGQMKGARTRRKGLAIKVSQDMIDYNKVDIVNKQIVQAKNSFLRSWEDYFLNAFLTNANIPTLAVGQAWGTSTAATGTAGTVYTDLAESVYNISNADADTATGSGVQKFDFEADTIVLNKLMLTRLLMDANVNKVLQVGDAATRQPFIAGIAGVADIIFGAFGLKVVTTTRLDPDTCILMQSGVVGGIADARPLGATPLYEHRPEETWRTDITRSSAVFIDQPKAALILTNINGGQHAGFNKDAAGNITRGTGNFTTLANPGANA